LRTCNTICRVFLAPFDCTTKQRVLGQKLRLINNFLGDDIREQGM
jgi:hypothetical protein